MTNLILKCPNCYRTQPLALTEDDTFIAVGRHVGPNAYEAQDNSEMSVFDAARLGWLGLEAANRTIRALSAEFERIVGELDVPPQGIGTQGPYVASSNRRLFHRPGCDWAAYFINTRSCEVFNTHEAAVAAGKRPCRTCCA